MRRPYSFKRPGPGFLVLALLALWLLPAIAMADIKKVTQPNQSMYLEPDFAGTPIASVPAGAEVNILEQKGDWYKVEYQGKSGWLNRQAFPAPGANFSLPRLLFWAPVKPPSSKEVDLAGKGFTPEVEASYKEKHQEMKFEFAEVERVEANKVDRAKLESFIKEGGLTP